MTEFKASDITIGDVMIDDHFAMGGEMYRISEVVKNPDDSELLNIGFISIADPPRHSLLIISKDMKFKIYNQNYKKE